MANRTKQSGIMRNSAVTQPYYSYELTRSLTRDPSARIRRTASCRPQTATRPHIHGAKPREGAHGSRTSTTRKSLNPASYRGKSTSRLPAARLAMAAEASLAPAPVTCAAGGSKL